MTNELDEAFENILNQSGKDYWILDGLEKTYDQREHIMAWGGFWVLDKRTWKIENIQKTDLAYKALIKAGLDLQACIDQNF